MALAREGAELGGVHVRLKAAQAVPVLVAVTALGKKKGVRTKQQLEQKVEFSLVQHPVRVDPCRRHSRLWQPVRGKKSMLNNVSVVFVFKIFSP